MIVSSIKSQFSPKIFGVSNKIRKPILFSGIDKFEKQETKSGAQEFIQWAEHSGFVESQLMDILNDDENIIGKGFSHTAYKIPQNSKYVIRISNFNELNNKNLKEANVSIKDVEDKNLEINCGQSVAMIVVDGRENIEILKKQEGYPAGVEPPSVIYEEGTGRLKKGKKHYECVEYQIKYEKTLADIASFPVKSYEDLLDNILIAQKAGYQFDCCNPNNFLIDENNKKINIIDLNKRSTIFKNELGNALYALCGAEYMTSYIGQRRDNAPFEETVVNAVTIIQKFVQAMKNKNLKFDKNNYYFFKLVDCFLFSFALENCGNKTKWEELKKDGLIYEE